MLAETKILSQINRGDAIYTKKLMQECNNLSREKSNLTFKYSKTLNILVEISKDEIKNEQKENGESKQKEQKLKLQIYKEAIKLQKQAEIEKLGKKNS